MGLSNREGVALAARPRSAARQATLGLSGTWDADPATLDNEYFKVGACVGGGSVEGSGVPACPPPH